MGAAGLRQHTKKEKQKCKNTNIQKHEKTKVQKWKKYENYKYTNTQTQGASEEITIGAVGLGLSFRLHHCNVHLATLYKTKILKCETLNGKALLG